MVEVIFCTMIDNCTMMVQYQGIKYNVPQHAAYHVHGYIYRIHTSHLTEDRKVKE